jgi:cytidylate kinase
MTTKKKSTPLVDSITFDGPAASGKSTIAEMLAGHLGFMFFDTGVMYRAVTLAALEKGLNIEGEQACTQLAEEIRINVHPPSKDDGRPNDILINGEDKTWQIRQPEVDSAVSIVSAYPGVRQALLLKQREIGRRGKVVMVGRDIGTVVLPEARLKIYLDATVEERARRRYKERIERGEQADFSEVLATVRLRDEIDSSRAVAPLRPADDAVIIDSDHKDIQTVFEEVFAIVKEKFPL